MFPKYRGKLFEDENLKITENQILGLEERQNAFKMRLGHAKKNAICTPCICYAPRACKKSGRNCLFLLPKWVKPALVAKT